MMLPRVHLNGTSKKELIEQYEQALDALYTACDKLHNAYPNARDYYPQYYNAIARAMDEHRSRMNRLSDVRRELEDILSHILGQQVQPK
jgi:hypothetical protein